MDFNRFRGKSVICFTFSPLLCRIVKTWRCCHLYLAAYVLYCCNFPTNYTCDFSFYSSFLWILHKCSTRAQLMPKHDKILSFILLWSCFIMNSYFILHLKRSLVFKRIVEVVDVEAVCHLNVRQASLEMLWKCHGHPRGRLNEMSESINRMKK